MIAGAVRVLGSVVFGDDTEVSDLDLLVDPTKGATMMDISKMKLEVSQLLSVTVDATTPNGLPVKFRGQYRTIPHLRQPPKLWHQCLQPRQFPPIWRRT